MLVGGEQVLEKVGDGREGRGIDEALRVATRGMAHECILLGQYGSGFFSAISRYVFNACSPSCSGANSRRASSEPT